MLLQLFKGSKISERKALAQCSLMDQVSVCQGRPWNICAFLLECAGFIAGFGCLMRKAMAVRWSIKDEKDFRISIRKLLKGSRRERKKYNFLMNVKWTNTQRSYCSGVALPSLHVFSLHHFPSALNIQQEMSFHFLSCRVWWRHRDNSCSCLGAVVG